MNNDVLELLSPSLIEQYPETVKEIDYLCGSLWKEIGWHYILDLVWILERLNGLCLQKGATIIDAGGGQGILQFLLADRGYNVLNIDFFPQRRPVLPSLAFSVYMMERGRVFEHEYIKHTAMMGSFKNKLIKLKAKLSGSRFAPLSLLTISFGKVLGWRKPGWIKFYCADMKDMYQMETDSVDAVVSLSAVEHIKINEISDAVKEFKRVLKPGAAMAVTTSAARDKDWFHNPSKGWCFTEATLTRLFDLERPESNFSKYDYFLEKLMASSQLRSRIASVYKISANTGMPYGTWNPQYQPVGILTVKR